MSKYKKKPNKIWLVLVVVLLIAAIGGIGYLTNWFQSDVKTFAVEYAGRKLVRDCTGLNVEAGAKFKVTTLSGETVDYTVKVYASGRETEDFEIIIGDEKTSWYENIVTQKSMNDFTEYFEIEKTGPEFTLQAVGFQTVLERRFANLPITGPAVLPEEVFRLEITVGKTTMKLGFRPSARVTGVTLPETLIIAG